MLDAMPLEKEVRRFIRSDVKIPEIIYTIKTNYADVYGPIKGTMHDVYFAVEPKTPYFSSLCMRQVGESADQQLFPQLKLEYTPQRKGVFNRVEFKNPSDVSLALKIRPPTNDPVELLRELENRYQREFVIRQDRTIIYLTGTEVSLDTVRYHLATNARIPPIGLAAG